MSVCLEPGCTAEMYVAYSFTMPVGSTGSESVTEMARTYCADGHHLNVKLETVYLPSEAC